VFADGKLLWSKLERGSFPDPDDVLRQVTALVR
jgi:hypothetical protein